MGLLLPQNLVNQKNNKSVTFVACIKSETT